MASSQPSCGFGSCHVCGHTGLRLTSVGEVHAHGPRSARCPGGVGGPSITGQFSQAMTVSTQPSTDPNVLVHCDVTQQMPKASWTAETTGSFGRLVQQPLIQPKATLDIQSDLQADSLDLIESWWQMATPPVIKWIPRGARHACASLLTHYLKLVVSNPTESNHWKGVFTFARSILGR